MPVGCYPARVHAWSARLLAIGLALVVLAPASSFASVLYACQMSGRTAKSCCCHAKHGAAEKAEQRAEQSARQTPAHELKGPACCELDAQHGTTPISIAPELLSQLVANAPLLELVEIPEQRLVEQQAACEPRSRGPPCAKTPRYIRHCTFLN